MVQTKFRDYESQPIDMADSDELILLIKNIIMLKIKQGYFRRWPMEALLSEGWIQIQNLIKSWDETKGVSFNKYCYLFLPTRISDGMSSFEEGMIKGPASGSSRYVHKYYQFAESEQEHSNPANGASYENTFAQHKETIVDRVLNHPSLTEIERKVVDMIGRGTTMKAIGASIGVTESRISQICKLIRSKVNE